MSVAAQPEAEIARGAASGGELSGADVSILVRRLVEAAAGELNPSVPASPAADARRRGAPWQEVLEEACQPHGLRVRTAFLTARDAVGNASPRTPLVIHRDGEAGWVALFDRARGRCRVIAPGRVDRWLGPEELASLLGAESAREPLPWGLVEPEMPAGRAAASGAKKGHVQPPLGRLLELVRPDRADLWTVVLYAALIGGLTLATPIAVQQLVNTVAFGGLVQPVVILALLLFGGLAFSALLSVLQAYTAELIQRRVFVRVVADVATRLPRVELGVYDRYHGPELMNRLFDVFTVQKTGAILMLEGTSVLLQTGVGLLVLSFYHPLMLAFSFTLIAGIAVVVFIFGRGAIATAIGESNAKYAVVGWMEELARHPAAFHSRAGRLFAVEQADRLASEYVGARRRHYRVVLRQLSSALGLQVLASSALLGLGGALVVSGQLTLGQLVASELIVTAIVAGVARLGKQFESFYDLLAATDKLGVLFDLPLEREGGHAPEEVQGPARLELSDLDFRFGSFQVLDGFSARIEPGERVGLFGPNGAGKTTLVEIICGLRNPDSGFVAIDGVDLRDLRLDDVRAEVVRVGKAEVFASSVLDNLRVARPDLSVADATAALEAVGLLDDVRNLPDGLHTPLATDGEPLSRGQIAALMLARAIVAKPRLLLLDEAFVNLQQSSRKQALDALFAKDAPWTVLAVSEWPDVLERCDRVIEIGAAEPEQPEAGS